MKLKIAEPGYDTFNGAFGLVQFENGVSVDHVSMKDAFQLSALIQMVDAETGESISMLNGDEADRLATARVEYYPSVAEVEAQKRMAEKVESAEQPVEVAQAYTREQLESIADKEGIAGLRKIGDALNLKGTSVAKLIDAILANRGSAPNTEVK